MNNIPMLCIIINSHDFDFRLNYRHRHLSFLPYFLPKEIMKWHKLLILRKHKRIEIKMKKKQVTKTYIHKLYIVLLFKKLARPASYNITLRYNEELWSSGRPMIERDEISQEKGYCILWITFILMMCKYTVPFILTLS